MKDSRTSTLALSCTFAWHRQQLGDTSGVVVDIDVVINAKRGMLIDDLRSGLVGGSFNFSRPI